MSRMTDVRHIMPMIAALDVISGVSSGATVGAGAWPSANLAIFVPWRVVAPTWARRVWYASGNATGNVDVGIYRDDGSLVVSSGATAQGSGNVVNFINITDTRIPPGDYFLGISFASATAQPFRNTTALFSRVQGVCQMAAAHPLPATATFAAAGQDYIPFFGVSTIAADL